ncbi:MAG: protein-L-isoaspartate(D-aspartate) O-methyltransferase [Bacteroidia bacterium]
MAQKGRNYIDLPKHQGLRKKLIQTIASKGITDLKVLSVMNEIPRHWFLDSAIDTLAYQDKAMAISNGQTISQPFTVAYQTQLLNVKPGQKVLEIGTGSGYQGTVLCKLGVELFTVERIKELGIGAHEMFQKLGVRPTQKVGDGTLGWPEKAPFDRIIVTAAAPVISNELFKQLKPEGVMVIPVGEKVQTMYRVIKTADGKAKTEKYSDFKFVPLIGEKGFNE